MTELVDGKVPECNVPHAPHSIGVVIQTTCDKTIRLTDTHLVATTKGYQTAVSLIAGDVLFGSENDDNDTCVVVGNFKESSVQQYFGLNCIHSEVLVNGIRASTFGDFHTLPSWYMYYAGEVLGVTKASKMGDYVAEWYYWTKSN
jgi:hypothetical protein